MSEAITSLENRSFHDLENFNAFEFVGTEERKQEAQISDELMNIISEKDLKPEDHEYIPFMTKSDGYKCVMYSTMSTYHCLMTLFTVYERMQYAEELIRNEMNLRYDYSQNHLKNMFARIAKRTSDNREEIIEVCTKEIFCITMCITHTRIKGHLDSVNYEDMIR